MSEAGEVLIADDGEFDSEFDGAGEGVGVGKVVRGDLFSDEGHRALGIVGRVARHVAELMVPIAAIVSFDDLFFSRGLGLEAGLGISLWYSIWVLRRTRRRRAERAAEFDDPHDEVEATGDFSRDLVSGLALLFLITWVLPSAPLYLERGYPMVAGVLAAAASVFGVVGTLSLKEGVLRALRHFRARRELEDWDPGDLLLDPGPDLDAELTPASDTRSEESSPSVRGLS